MNISRAFSYPFDDPDWLSKLLITALFTAAAVVLSPFIVGLGVWAVVFGWEVALIRSWRRGVPRPLPAWNDIGGFFSRGLNVLAALIVYQLPNLLLGCCISLFTGQIGETLTGTGTALISLCCFLPVLLAYNVLTLPMFAVATGRYSEDPRIGVFFEFSQLFTRVQTNLNDSFMYVIWYFVALLALSFVNLIPCLGTVAALALAVPVLGALTAQYIDVVLGKPKRA